MEIFTIALLVILIALAIFDIFQRRQNDSLPSKIDSLLKDQFLNFQSNVNKEIGSARQEVNAAKQEVSNSKDMMSQSTLETIKQIKDMEKTIHKIIQQQEEVQNHAQSLRDVLQGPKLRGNYGETILEEMLEKVLPKGIWERQYSIDGREKVDVVVKFKEVIVPIDAKFPRDAYKKYLDAVTPAEKAQRWKEHEKVVKEKINDISKKYVRPELGTTEFALMFIPSEAIYYETIAEKNHLGESSNLYEYAQEKKVIPVSPNTFYAFLQVVILGIRNMDVVKNAKKLQEGLATVQRSFDMFYRKFEDIGKNIDKASESYRIGGGHIERYKKQLDSTLQLDGFEPENIDGELLAGELDQPVLD
jgi:DNA recombination protein RmuC